MELDSTVHYGEDYNNAFWNGAQMVYGDGNGEIFQRFTKSIDVIDYELTHGVTQYEADLGYEGQTRALNESYFLLWQKNFDNIFYEKPESGINFSIMN